MRPARPTTRTAEDAEDERDRKHEASASTEDSSASDGSSSVTVAWNSGGALVHRRRSGAPVGLEHAPGRIRHDQPASALLESRRRTSPRSRRCPDAHHLADAMAASTRALDHECVGDVPARPDVRLAATPRVMRPTNAASAHRARTSGNSCVAHEQARTVDNGDGRQHASRDERKEGASDPARRHGRRTPIGAARLHRPIPPIIRST